MEVIIPFLCGEENCGDNCKDSFMSNGGMSALWSELLVCSRYLRTRALILGSVVGWIKQISKEKTLKQLHIRTQIVAEVVN